MKKYIYYTAIILLPTAISFAQLHHFLVQASGGGNISTQTAGVPLFIEVVAKDTTNATVTSYAGTVSISSTGTLLSGSGITPAFVNGVLLGHMIKFSNTGNFTITATRTSGTETGTSNLFTVNAGTASKVQVETTPDGSGTIVPLQNIVAGTQLLVYSIARDTMNNFVSNIAADTWSIQNVTGGIVGTDLIPSIDNKSATFTGHIMGSTQIKATSGVLTSINSGTLTAIAGSANKLAFVQQPTIGIAGATITPPVIVRVKDTFNNNVLITGDTITMSLPIGQGTLYGTLKHVTNDTGLVSFNDLSINEPGAKTLITSATTLTQAISDTFIINTYTITSAAGAHGTILPSGSVSVIYAANQAFTISPDIGFHLDSLLVDGIRVDSTTSYTFVNIVNNHIIRAVFAADIPVVNIKVFLQGPYSGVGMSTVIHNILPNNQPYNTPPWNYTGTENVVSIPANVVDWILLELRTGIGSLTKVAFRAAFIKSDGTVVDLDGTNPVRFTNIAVGNYYIVIRHRNHIPVMSATAAALTATSSLYDFTTQLSQYYGGEAANLGSGKYGMFAGDYSEDNLIDIKDFIGPDNEMFQQGYKKSDLNLDGLIDIKDFISPDNNMFKITNVPE